MQKDYQALSPDLILDAIESQGYEVNARILSLNSYENRVFQIGLEENDDGIEETVIAKFYRPERWSNEQILEEHRFAFQLAQQEIPIVPPKLNANDQSLFEYQGYRFALFERKGGYAPEPGRHEHLERLGGLLGRIHQYAQEQRFETRDTLSIERNFVEPYQFLLEQFIPKDLSSSYQELCIQLLEKINQRWSSLPSLKIIKCHGDWHLGNILWREESGGHIVDLDDCLNAPAVQDMWMMLSGEQHEQQSQLETILKGYQQFCFFDRNEFKMIESLRAMRIVYYTAWLAKRWEDPAFPKNFPWFNTQAFWLQHMRELQDQIPLIDSDILTSH